MIKYHGDRLWVKLQLGLASILWGLLVAFISLKVTEGFEGPIQTLARVIIFLWGFYSLEIGAKKINPEEEESS